MSSKSAPESNAVENWTFQIVSDGTATVAALYASDAASGTFALYAKGESRRRKGEARNPELGSALAAQRAFEAAARRAAQSVAAYSRSPKVAAREERAAQLTADEEFAKLLADLGNATVDDGDEDDDKKGMS